MLPKATFAIYSVLFGVALGGFLATPSGASAEVALCSGWNPETESWGLIGLTIDGQPQNCPAEHAFVTLRFQGGPRRPGRFVAIAGTCCPLPADALLDEHQFVNEECPDGFVGTGLNPIDQQGTVVYQLRCTKIDPSRYQLGPTYAGIDANWNHHFREYFNATTSLARIPFGLRLGAGRLDKFGWDRLFCLGYPWGGLLVGKTAKYCSTHRFRQLLTRSTTGSDPTTVLEYDRCLAVDDPYHEQPVCILERPKRN